MREDCADNDASTVSQTTTPKTPVVTSPRGQSDESKSARREAISSRLEKAEIKVEEVQFCQATDYSAQFHKAGSVEEESLISPKSVGDDDVFDSMTSANKNKSLIEMFAANPKHKIDADNPSPTTESHRNFKPLNLNPSTPTSSASNVRVVLVRTPDKEDGHSGFETKVINSPGENTELETPRHLQKRKSWSNLSPSSDEPRRRTRLRSSSLTRARMRAAMAPDS